MVDVDTKETVNLKKMKQSHFYHSGLFGEDDTTWLLPTPLKMLVEKLWVEDSSSTKPCPTLGAALLGRVGDGGQLSEAAGPQQTSAGIPKGNAT